MFQILNFLHSEEGRRKKEEGRRKKEEGTRYLCRAVLRASEAIAEYFPGLPLSHSPTLPLCPSQVPDLEKSPDKNS